MMNDPKTILLVDDEADNPAALSAALRKCGYTVIVAPDGGAGLSFVRAGTSVDLVIAEHRMPRMDGMDFLARIKRALPATPVIVLTAEGSVAAYLRALSLGAYEYIHKPVRVSELARIIQSALEFAPGGAYAVNGWANIG